jgi:hypothetical protein
MISDVLFKAVDEIDDYLKDDVFANTYTGKLRKDIINLRDKMDIMRKRLDTPPKFKTSGGKTK